MTTLIPMTEADFAAYIALAIPCYAHEKVVSRDWDESASLDLARAAVETALPAGLKTPGHHFYLIHDDTPQQNVGAVWIAEQTRGGSKVAFVDDVFIRPEYQRLGHATRAFGALEEQVRALGCTSITLHVFGHNTGAQALYHKLGFAPTNIYMYKALDQAD